MSATYQISVREGGEWSPLQHRASRIEAVADAEDMAQDAEAVVLALAAGSSVTPVAAWRRCADGHVRRCTVREALAA